MQAAREPDVPRYRERLRVPVLWWVLAAAFVLSLWLAYSVAVSPAWALLVGLLAAAAAAALLVGYGAVRVAVTGTHLEAGRARLPHWAVGDVRALDRAEVRRLTGRDADVTALLVLRSYAHGAVQVVLDDPDDPVPYWVVSTRRPRELAAALLAARDELRSAEG